MVANPMLPDVDFKEKIADIYKAGNTIKFYKFVSLVYDFNSPLVLDFPELSERKKQASIILDYEYNENDFNYDVVTEFVIKKLNSNLWTLITANENTFEEYTGKVNKRISEELDEDKQLKAVQVKNTMLEQMEKMIDRIQNLKNKLFWGDIELVTASGKIKNYTSENVAKHIDKR